MLNIYVKVEQGELIALIMAAFHLGVTLQCTINVTAIICPSERIIFKIDIS